MPAPARIARSWPISIVVGVLAGVISIGRLWLFDRSAPAQVLWAEDGLFTLCIAKADFFTCLADPFAGYLPFLQRVLAWPVSLLPWEQWAIGTNIVAALTAGVVSALALIMLRRFGLGWYVAIIISLLPVITPIAGLEVINSIGNTYMLMLFLATLLVALPGQARGEPQSVGYLIAGSVLLLITALTIPSAVVIIVLLIIMAIRGYWPIRTTLIWTASLVLGLAVQFIYIISAQSPRQFVLGSETLNLWADSIPISILTNWPGLSIAEYTFFTNFQLTPFAYTGWLFAVALLALSVWWILRGSLRRVVVGVLVLGGLGFGFIPSAIGFANNRYFVVPVLLWAAALLIGLDSRISRTRPWIIVLITVVIAAIWSPAIAASAYRATPAPPWSEEVARVEARCTAEPEFIDRPIFTPFWPPNWGDGLTEPTHPNLPCLVVWRLMGE